jgi:hypothetical protein
MGGIDVPPNLFTTTLGELPQAKAPRLLKQLYLPQGSFRAF